MGVKELEVADTETSFWYIFFSIKERIKMSDIVEKCYEVKENLFFFSVVIVDHACL